MTWTIFLLHVAAVTAVFVYGYTGPAWAAKVEPYVRGAWTIVSGIYAHVRGWIKR